MPMNTIEELKYYCMEPEPSGALMLIGEWGCGKTYLINHVLSEELKKTHILIRISLFGVSTTNDISDAVKQAWIKTSLESNNVTKIWGKKFFDHKDSIAKFVGSFSKTVGSVLSFDALEFIPISPKIGERSVVLVFDDLERCRINTSDLLGVINEYCENQKFHTIIVANEDYILEHEKACVVPAKPSKNSTDEKSEDVPRSSAKKVNLSYNEIKEKIVQRTIKISPDYNSIIRSIVEKYATNDKEYKRFLVDHTEELQNLFGIGSPITNMDRDAVANGKSLNRPHNIRSFRCAIQDFQRVFNLLKSHEIATPLDKWLYSFVMFTMAYKAGIVSKGAYSDVFVDYEISDIYSSSYENKYILDFEKQWILNGEWDEELAKIQIEELKNRQRAESPYDLVRTNYLTLLDEDVFNEGFPKVLENAYSGNLLLDDYLQLIYNIFLVRKTNLAFPKPVKWNKIEDGIKCMFENMIKNGTSKNRIVRCFDDATLDSFTEDERKIYSLIEEIQNGNKLMYLNNRREFLTLMENDFRSAFLVAEQKRLDRFDEEMAESIIRVFVNCNNSDRTYIVANFKNIWELNIQSMDINYEKTLEGLKHLYKELEKAKSNVDETYGIVLYHFTSFLKLVSNLISKTELLKNRAKSPETP